MPFNSIIRTGFSAVVSSIRGIGRSSGVDKLQVCHLDRSIYLRLPWLHVQPLLAFGQALNFPLWP